MNLSKYIKLAAVAMLLLAGIGSANAEATAPVGYMPIKTPQAVQTPGKTEVVEVFWYRCGHCFDFDPAIEQWSKNLPKDVSFRRVPVMWDESRAPDAKLYYTLETMDLLERLHSKVFSAIHVDKLMVQSQEKLLDWVSAQGVDRKAFADVYNSFSTMTKVNKARELTKGYGVTGVPAMVVNGKYLITNTTAGGTNEGMLAVADRLINGNKSAAVETAPNQAEQTEAKPVEKVGKKVAKKKSTRHLAKNKSAEAQVAVAQ
ncbi:MAG: thiol:disulfide interchange protein DsbA/DsbL [Burkholderiales bacterium]